MNKKFFISLSSVAAVMLFSGCSMCSAPIPKDPSCIEDTHISSKIVNPDALSFVRPNIGTSKELFRPVFKAGAKRVSAIGTGNSAEEATSDALGKILREHKCDYLVAVTRIIATKTHPTWRFFATTNYTVEISGLPIFLDKLSVDEYKQPVELPAKGSQNGKVVLVKKTCPPPMAMLSLTDVNVNITAKGQTPDKVGVAFPVCPKACPAK